MLWFPMPGPLVSAKCPAAVAPATTKLCWASAGNFAQTTTTNCDRKSKQPKAAQPQRCFSAICHQQETTSSRRCTNKHVEQAIATAVAYDDTRLLQHTREDAEKATLQGYQHPCRHAKDHVATYSSLLNSQASKQAMTTSNS